jgi:oxaloacetate decarboxylase gamma subunit
MTIIEMLQQSALLTILGMTVVFVFLWIMVICVNATGKLIHKLGWDKDVRPPENTTKPAGGGTTPAVSGEVTAAISAAVTEYRKQ